MNDATSIRVAVLGAGAVGCYYGGMLARAGHRVVLIGRPLHMDAIAKDGLRFETRNFSENIRMDTSASAEAVRGAKLVLFCVKSTDTEKAAAEIAPHLDAGALVVNLQNGVDNAERIEGELRSSKVASAVIPAAVYVASEMKGPGHLKHHGRGDLVLGPSDEKIKAWFEGAGIPVTISDNIAGELWSKLVLNCAYNAISAITQLPYGKMIQGPGVRELMRDVVGETLAVAEASGVRMAPGMLERTLGLADSMPTQFSSTAQDLARGKPTEIDHLNGLVVRKGEALGIATPANRALYALVKLLENKRVA